MRLLKFLASVEAKDIKAATTSQETAPEEADPTESQESALLKKGLKALWGKVNVKSIDGLPGLLEAHKSQTVFDAGILQRDWGKDDESIPSAGLQTKTKVERRFGVGQWLDVKFLVGIMLGIVLTRLWANLDVLVEFGEKLRV